MDPLTAKILGTSCLALASAMALHQADFLGSDPAMDSEKLSAREMKTSPSEVVALRKPAKSRDRSREPRKLGTIIVGGYVKMTGPVKIVEGMTLADALEKAGGVNEFGAIKRAALIRNGKRTPCDLSDATASSTPVIAGDVLEISQKTWFGL